VSEKWSEHWSERAHFAPLDGVRGIAILMVMVFHFFLGMPTASGFQQVVAAVTSAGWAGVDLFFVLSGFLITGILIDTKNHSSYYKSFYARRALRIFPAYYTFIILIGFVIGPLLVWNYQRTNPGVPSEPAQNLALFRNYQAYYWLYLTNVLIAIKGFAPTVLWMTPFWSLAVEEQFYLVWPFIVRRLNPSRLLSLAIGAIVLASVIRVLIYATGIFADPPVAAAMLTPSRMDPLAAGAVVAIMMRRKKGAELISRHARRLLAASVAALGVIVVVNGGLPEMDAGVQPFVFPLNALAGAALIGLSVTQAASVGANRILSSRLLREFGVYSYGLYIVHTPVFWFTERVRDAVFSGPPESRTFLSLIVWFLIATLLAFVVAWTMWHLLERHFLGLKRRFPSGGDLSDKVSFAGVPAG
jgi:peptidoglycan/LPS O-acetylase OafA/YrhL